MGRAMRVPSREAVAFQKGNRSAGVPAGQGIRQLKESVGLSKVSGVTPRGVDINVLLSKRVVRNSRKIRALAKK